MIPFHKQLKSFICNGKEWGVDKSEGERERKRKSERQSVCGKGYGLGHKLTH